MQKYTIYTVLSRIAGNEFNSEYLQYIKRGMIRRVTGVTSACFGILIREFGAVFTGGEDGLCMCRLITEALSAKLFYCVMASSFYQVLSCGLHKRPRQPFMFTLQTLGPIWGQHGIICHVLLYLIYYSTQWRSSALSITQPWYKMVSDLHIITSEMYTWKVDVLFCLQWSGDNRILGCRICPGHWIFVTLGGMISSEIRLKESSITLCGLSQTWLFCENYGESCNTFGLTLSILCDIIKEGGKIKSLQAHWPCVLYLWVVCIWKFWFDRSLQKLTMRPSQTVISLTFCLAFLSLLHVWVIYQASKPLSQSATCTSLYNWQKLRLTLHLPHVVAWLRHFNQIIGDNLVTTCIMRSRKIHTY